jgi:hypothetical protein
MAFKISPRAMGHVWMEARTAGPNIALVKLI